MKYFKLLGLVVVTAFILYFVQISKADDTPAPKDGKAIFLDKHCDACHSIESQSIEAKRKSDKVPDLSKVDLKGKTDWIKSFITKEADIDGKKHPIKFNGTDDELGTISSWIESLSPAVKDSTNQK